MSVEFLRQTFGRKFNMDITGKRTATRMYYMKLDTPVDELSDALALAIGAGLPDLGDAYGSDSNELGMIATSHEPMEVQKELGYYQIQVNYETQTLNMAAPTERPWQISFSSEKVEFVPSITRWNTGVVFPIGAIKAVAASEPILNTAGDPFDPPVMAYRIRPIITLQKNFADLSDIGSITTIAQLMSYVGKVNSAAITIAGIYANYGQFIMDDINCVYTEADGGTFYNTTFRIIYDEEYFCEKVLNAGYNQLVGGKTVGLTAKDGTAFSSPQLLDANGALIVAATPALKQAAAIYRAFGTQYGIAYATLGLPTTF